MTAVVVFFVFIIHTLSWALKDRFLVVVTAVVVFFVFIIHAKYRIKCYYNHQHESKMYPFIVFVYRYLPPHTTVRKNFQLLIDTE